MVSKVAGLERCKSQILSKNNIIETRVTPLFIISLHFSEEISNFTLRKLLEGLGLVSRLDDSNLDITVSEFSLKTVLEALDSGVDGILDINVVSVGLLKVVSSSVSTLTHGSGFPAVESTRSFDLIDLGTVFFRVASNDNSDSEGTDTTTLGVFLEELS